MAYSDAQSGNSSGRTKLVNISCMQCSTWNIENRVAQPPAAMQIISSFVFLPWLIIRVISVHQRQKLVANWSESRCSTWNIHYRICYLGVLSVLLRLINVAGKSTIYTAFSHTLH